MSELPAKKTPTLSEADKWFNEEIIPKRSAAAGFSGNRIWKGPRAIIFGNDADPDGLCGDASYYVYERFFSDFGGYQTRDGFHMGLILWDGIVLNHIANIMLATGRKAVQSYKWDTKKKMAVRAGEMAQYNSAELLGLHVYDLYYKKKNTTVRQWWRDLDGEMDGTIKIALLHNID